MKLKNNNKGGQLYTLTVKREKRKKKQKHLVTGDNPTTISLYAPYHVVEDMAAHTGRWQMTIWPPGGVTCATWMTRTLPTHWRVWNTSHNFSIKKLKNKTWKIPKHPQRKNIFFKVKNIHLLYIESEKTWNTIVQQLNIFLILEAKKYFYCYETCEKSRKLLVNNSNFC